MANLWRGFWGPNRILKTFPVGTGTGSFTVTTASQVFAAEDDKRATLQLFNTGNQAISIQFDGAAVVGAGFPIPTGEVLVFSLADSVVPTGSVNAIVSSATSGLTIVELNTPVGTGS